MPQYEILEAGLVVKGEVLDIGDVVELTEEEAEKLGETIKKIEES
jgi:hypothetical protein